MKGTLKTPNKFVESAKKGFNDIKVVMEEGNYKLFLKQFIVIVVLILAYRHLVGKLDAQKSNVRGQIAAVQAQSSNEKDYLSNKKKLLDLEPRFPDVAEKNDWLLRQIVALTRESNIVAKLGSSQTEDTTNPNYTMASLPVTFPSSFADFGRFLANVENKTEYLRVTDFSLKKNTEVLGQNDITITINTIFPKEKIADKMFKTGGKK